MDTDEETDGDSTGSEDDSTMSDSEPQWPPWGAAFSIRIRQPYADTTHSPTVTPAAAPGAQDEPELLQHMGSVASVPIHTMEAALAPCTDPDPTVSVTVKRHTETNAPVTSSDSEKALEEALVRDATAARAATSYQRRGDLPYQRLNGPVHQRLDGPWSKRVL